MIETTPTVIRGHMSNSYLQKMDRVFDGKIETAIVEMLQNSRRASADRIEVSARHIPTSDGDHIRIIWSDNGVGLESPQMLLEVGDSDWRPDVKSNEDPGGQGFYAVLCAATAAGVVVRSRSWEVQIDMESAKGLTDTPVVPAPCLKGLTLDFTFAVPQDFKPAYGYKFLESDVRPLQWLQSEIHKLSAASGIEVLFNGVQLPCFDFLMGATHVQEYRGVRIGVFCDSRENQYSGFDDTKRYTPEFKTWFGGYGGPLGNTVNFYGVHPATRELPSLDHWDSNGCGRVRVRWDIRDTAAVKMTLPQRDKLVDSVELQDVLNFSKQIATSCSLRFFDGRHQMPFAYRNDLQDATTILLPEAQARIKHWSIGNRESGRDRDVWPDLGWQVIDPQDEVILIDYSRTEPSIMGLHLLLGACYSDDVAKTWMADRTTAPSGGVFALTDHSGNERRIMFARARRDFRGYKWYDRLLDLDDDTNEFEFIVSGEVDGEPVKNLVIKGEDAAGASIIDGEFPSGRVDGITLRASFGDRPAIDLTLPFIMAVTPGGHDAVEGNLGELLVACDPARWDVFIQDRIYNCTGPSSDETTEEETEDAYRNVREFVTKVFHGKASIVQSRMEKAAGEISGILDVKEICEVLTMGKFLVTLNGAAKWPRLVVTWVASLKEGKDLQG